MTLRERLEWNSIAEQGGDDLRAILRRMRDKAYGIAFFINVCGWTFAKNVVGDPWIPFLLFPFQEVYTRWVGACTFYNNPLTGQIGIDNAVEKCRDAGVSWLDVYFDLWAMTFFPGYTVHYTSRDEELVDNSGDPACYFWRLEKAVERLPHWLAWPGYNHKRHRSKFYLENPATGAVATGEPPVTSFASGGRYNRCVPDEFSKMPERVKRDLWTSCGQSTPCRSARGTPRGVDFYATLTRPQQFGEMVQDGNKARIPVFVFDWRDDPRKNRYVIYDARGEVIREGEGYSPLTGERREGWPGTPPPKQDWCGVLEPPPLPVVPEMPAGGVRVEYPWFEFQKTRYAEWELAQEVCRNYEKSGERMVYSNHLRLMDQYPKRHTGEDLARDPRFPLYIGCDPGRSDTCALVYIQFNTILRRYEIIDILERTEQDAEYYVPFLTGRREDWRFAEAPIEEGAEDGPRELSPDDREFLERHTGPHWRPVAVYAGPDIKQEHLAAKKSTYGIWRKYVKVFYRDEYKDFTTRVNQLRLMMERTAITLTTCGRLWAVLMNVRRPLRSRGTQSTNKPKGYIHDDTDLACALEQVACFDPHPLEEDEKGGYGRDGRDGQVPGQETSPQAPTPPRRTSQELRRIAAMRSVGYNRRRTRSGAW